MRSRLPSLRLPLGGFLATGAVVLLACSPPRFGGNQNAVTGDGGGTGGTSGSAGDGGTAGGGTGGTAGGSAGDGGTASGGTGGSDGDGGTGGTGGSAGNGGTGGVAGTGGTGGTSGTGGASGSAGGGTSECASPAFLDDGDCVMALDELDVDKRAVLGFSPTHEGFYWGDLAEYIPRKWGSDIPKSLPSPGGRILSRGAAGGWHACALDDLDAAHCWGRGVEGQLGNGSESHALDTTVPVVMPTEKTFSEIGAGLHHTCAVDKQGVAYCWGYGDLNQIGDGDSGNHSEPKQVIMPSERQFSRLGVGDDHTCVLDQHDAAWCWGQGDQGQLGNTTVDNSSKPAPVEMPDSRTFSSVTAGGMHSCAIDDLGHAHCWGNSGEGQLGTGSLSRKLSPAPVKMPPSTTFSEVSAGYRHSCALDQDGAAWCWGNGEKGELGDGQLEDTDEPSPVTMPTDRTFVTIGTGDSFTCALDQNGVAYCWGKDTAGQTGQGATGLLATPAKVIWP